MVLHFQFFTHFSRSFAHIWELHMIDLFTIFTHFSSFIQISQPDAGTTWSWINLALGQGVDIVLSTQEYGAGSNLLSLYLGEEKTSINSLTSYFMLFWGRVRVLTHGHLASSEFWLFSGYARFAMDLATKCIDFPWFPCQKDRFNRQNGCFNILRF